MKHCGTIYLAKQAVIGLEDTKVTSEKDRWVLFNPASLTRMKCWKCPTWCPEFAGGKIPTFLAGTAKIMQNLDANLTIMLQIVQLLSHSWAGTWQAGQAEEGNKNENYQLLWNTKLLQSNITSTCPTKANPVLWCKRTFLLAEGYSTLHREQPAGKEEAQTLHLSPLLHSPQKSTFKDF